MPPPIFAGARSAIQPVTAASFHASPLPNVHEQKYILDTILYENKLKVDQFHRANRDEERLVWMVRMAEGLAESRIGFDTYQRLHALVTDSLIEMAQSIESLNECIEAAKHCSQLISRVYCQIVLIERLHDADKSVFFGDLRDEIGGVLNPVKGIALRAFAHQKVPQLFDTQSLALNNTIGMVSLLSRWTKYGGCEDVEVREWERDNMYCLVEQALHHFLSLCRGDLEHLFAEFVVEKFVCDFLCGRLLDDVMQYKLFLSILDSIPKAIVTKFLEKLLLAVVRFSPALNITLLLQRLCEDAFGEGSVSAQVVWERIKEIITMRPELDLNDALQLCNSVATLSLREEKASVVANMLSFIETNLLDDIQLSSTEPASYALINIFELIVCSLRSEESVNLLLPAIISIGEKKTDKACLTGLGRKVLHSIKHINVSDWTAISALLHLAEEPVEDIVVEIASRNDLSHSLPFFKPYPDFMQAIVSFVLGHHNIANLAIEDLKNALQPPRLEHFQLYIDLLPRFDSPRDRYDLLVSVWHKS